MASWVRTGTVTFTAVSPTALHLAKEARRIHVQYVHEAVVIDWDQFPHIIGKTNLISFWKRKQRVADDEHFVNCLISGKRDGQCIHFKQGEETTVWRIESRRARRSFSFSNWCLHVECSLCAAHCGDMQDTAENIPSPRDGKHHVRMSFSNLRVLILLSGFCTPPLGWKR